MGRKNVDEKQEGMTDERLDMPRCVVDHAHGSDEGHCVYETEAEYAARLAAKPSAEVERLRADDPACWACGGSGIRAARDYRARCPIHTFVALEECEVHGRAALRAALAGSDKMTWHAEFEPDPKVERLQRALLHVTMRRHDFSEGCDGCLLVRQETRAAFDEYDE